MTIRIPVSHDFLLIVFAAALASSTFSAHAEKLQMTGKNTATALVSTTTFPGNTPKGKIELTVRKGQTSSDNPDWDGTEYTQYHLIIRDGKVNRQVGHIVNIHKNGDASFASYDGSATLVIKKDKSWETTWEGTWHSSGGTGKFANLKGSGAYNGMATPKKDMGTSWEGTVEY